MLIDKLKDNQLIARKAKNEIATSLLTTLYSEAGIVGKNNGNRQTTDDEVISVIKKFMKSANENKEIYTKSNNQEKLKVIDSEIIILNSYLPESISEEKIGEAINEILTQQNLPKEPASMGKIMKELKNKFGATLDGALASKIIKTTLSS